MNSQAEIITAIQSAQKPLIVTHEGADGDAVGASLALFLLFLRLGRQPTVVIDKGVPEALSFLPGADKSLVDGFFPRQLSIQLSTQNTEVDSLQWARDDEGGNINIVVNPKSGRFDPSNIVVKEKGIDFDSIFALDVAAVSRMGKVYDKNKDLFEKLQVVNIDHHPDNPMFGNLNFVFSDKSSTAEILANIFSEMEKDNNGLLIDADIATCLLAGIIADTGSFQHANTRPETLQVAGDLVRRGARRDEIIQHIYNTRRLSTLRLWGQVLSKMQIDKEARLAWSTISQKDCDAAGANIDERKGLINDLMSHVSEADMVILMTEDGEGGIRASVRTKGDNYNAKKVAEKFGGGGHDKASGFGIANKSLEEAEREIIAVAQEVQNISLQRESAPSSIQKINQEGTSGEVSQKGDAPSLPREPEGPIEDAVTARLRELQQNNSSRA